MIGRLQALAACFPLQQASFAAHIGYALADPEDTHNVYLSNLETLFREAARKLGFDLVPHAVEQEVIDGAPVVRGHTAAGPLNPAYRPLLVTTDDRAADGHFTDAHGLCVDALGHAVGPR